jgi:hypothetical protein
MRKEGYKNCTAGFVSTVKSQERKRVANGDAPPPPRAGAPSPVAKRGRKAIVQISIDGLKAAKSLIDDLGSPEKAHEVLDNLERIGGIARCRATLDALEALK